MSGKFAGDNQPLLKELMQRTHVVVEPTDPVPIDEELRQEAFGTRASASSSSFENWQSAQWWWSDLERTSQRSDWWTHTWTLDQTEYVGVWRG
ncbi:MAG: hypothetical protein ACKPKO_20590, partial [Candidatus Fonsibacter sp.]